MELHARDLAVTGSAGRAAQREAEEAVQEYFALTAEDKRAYMRVRVYAVLHQPASKDHRQLHCTALQPVTPMQI